jgi:hypothetical protein
VPEQKFITSKTPKAKLLHGDDPKKYQWERVLRFCRDGKIESNLIAEPKAREQGRDIGKDESDSRQRHGSGN